VGAATAVVVRLQLLVELALGLAGLLACLALDLANLLAGLALQLSGLALGCTQRLVGLALGFRGGVGGYFLDDFGGLLCCLLAHVYGDHRNVHDGCVGNMGAMHARS